jgi:hypothetical protein
MDTPTTEQLNQAAKLSAHRKIDFEAALEMVMTDPTAAEAALNPNKPIALRVPQPSGLTGQEVKELLASVYEKGRGDAVQDARISALEDGYKNVGGLTSALAAGFANHLDQHEANNANPEVKIDPAASRSLILEAMEKFGVRGDVAKALARLDSQPVAVGQ